MSSRPSALHQASDTPLPAPNKASCRKQSGTLWAVCENQKERHNEKMSWRRYLTKYSIKEACSASFNQWLRSCSVDPYRATQQQYGSCNTKSLSHHTHCPQQLECTHAKVLNILLGIVLVLAFTGPEEIAITCYSYDRTELSKSVTDIEVKKSEPRTVHKQIINHKSKNNIHQLTYAIF